MIVMPGLVNAHQHTGQTGISGIAGDWTLFDNGQHMHAGLATRFLPEDVYLANVVGALNQLNGGERMSKIRIAKPAFPLRPIYVLPGLELLELCVRALSSSSRSR